MSRAALVLASIVAAIAGLAAGAACARIYYLDVVRDRLSSDDGDSVIDDITVLKQLRFGGQEADALRYLERRLEDDIGRLAPYKDAPDAERAQERAVRYLLKYYQHPALRR